MFKPLLTSKISLFFSHHKDTQTKLIKQSLKIINSDVSIHLKILVKNHPIPGTKLFIKTFKLFDSIDFEIYRDIILVFIKDTQNGKHLDLKEFLINRKTVKYLITNKVFPVCALNGLICFKLCDINCFLENKYLPLKQERNGY